MIDYNSLGLPTSSKIYLCRPDNKILCVLNGVAPSSCKCHKQIRNLWTIDFDVKKYIAGNTSRVVSNGYQSIRPDMKLFVDGIGFFTIESVSVEKDRINEIKTVSATCIAAELKDKILHNIKINCGTEDSQEYLVSGNISNIITTSSANVRDTSIADEYVELYRDTSVLEAITLSDSNECKNTIIKALYFFPKLIDYVKFSVSQQDKEYILDALSDAEEYYSDKMRDTTALKLYISEYKESDFSGWGVDQYRAYRKILHLYPYIYQQYYNSDGTLNSANSFNKVVRIRSSNGSYVENGYTELIAYYKQLSLLDIIIEKSECNWSINTVDKSVAHKKFSFDIDGQDVYSFLMNDLSKTAEIIFLFDNLHRKINVVSIENLGVDTNIHVQYRNLLNTLNITPDEEYSYTRYLVSGADDLNIDYVNFGNSYIDNLDYYLNAKDDNGDLIYMTQELSEKYKAYKQYKESVREDYISLTKQYNELMLKRHELINRVPNDYCTTEWNTVDDESLEKMRVGFVNLKAAIEALYYSDYPNNAVPIDDEEIKDTFYWHDWYAYTYIIIPSIELEQTNRLNGTSIVNTNTEAYLTEWSLYGLDELNVRLNDLKNQKQALERSDVINYNKDWFVDILTNDLIGSITITNTSNYQNKPTALPNVFNYNSVVYSIPLSTFSTYLTNNEGFTQNNNNIILNGLFGHSQHSGLERNTSYVTVSVESDGEYKNAIYGGASNNNANTYYWVYIDDESNSPTVSIFVHYDFNEIDASTVSSALEKTQINVVAVSKEIFDEYNVINYNAIKKKYGDVCTDILSCQSAVNSRQLEIDTVEDDMDDINEQRSSIVNSCRIENWIQTGDNSPSFTSKELKTLNRLIKETSYSNENILKTDLDNIVTEIDIQQDLLKKAKEELSIASQPQLHFDVEIENLFNIEEFRLLTSNFDIGNYVWVEYRDGHEVKLRLIGIEYNPMIPNDKLSVEFSNLKRSNVKCNDFIDLLDRTFSNSRSSSGGSSSGSSTAHESEITIDNNLLRAMLKSDYFGSAVKNVVLNSLNVDGDAVFNVLSAKNAKYNDLKNGTTEINGGCIKSGAILSRGYNGSVTLKSESEQIYESGAYNYAIDNTSGSIIDLDNGYFSFAGGKLKYDGDNLSVRGNVYADGGEIAKWTISEYSIYDETDADPSSIVGMNKHGHGQAFYAGSSNINGNGAAFRVSHTGQLVTSDLICQDTSGSTNNPQVIIKNGSIKIKPSSDAESDVPFEILSSTTDNGLTWAKKSQFKSDRIRFTKNSGTSWSYIAYGAGESNINDGFYVSDVLYLSGGRIECRYITNTQANDNDVSYIRPNTKTNGEVYGKCNLGSNGRRWHSVYCSDGTWNGSDKKIKDHVEYLYDDENLEDFIMGLKPIMYKLKNGEGRRNHMGLYAQDVSNIAHKTIGDIAAYQATVISKGKDGELVEHYFDENVSDDNLSWVMNYNELIAPMVAFIQKSADRINELEQKVEILENNS